MMLIRAYMYETFSNKRKSFKFHLYEGHAKIIDTPFPNAKEGFIHQLENQLF